MTTITQPEVTVNIVNASQEVQNTAHRILFVGQKTSAGTAVSGELVENILNDNSENTLFGENSMLAAMVRAAKENNKVTRMDAIPLDDDGAGVAATGSFDITGGPATAAGTLEVVVGSDRNHTYSIAVASGDTVTDIGDAIEAAITADAKVPVTAINAVGVVTVTAVNAGTLGNDISLGISGSVPGITTGVTGMASGATDPTLTGVFDVIGEERYQTIVWPYAGDTTELTDLLDARFNAENRVQDGMGITCKQDSLSNHLAALALLNSQSLGYITDKAESTANFAGSAQTELSPVKSAVFGSIRGLRLTEGANISRFVITTNGALDGFGGPALASKPYFNTNTPNLPLIRTGFGWLDTEIEQLSTAGGIVMGQNPVGNEAIMGEAVTTYKNDSAGNPDVTFKFMNYVDTASNAREYFANNLRARFAQSRLTEGNVLAGRDMANALTIQNYCELLYQDLSGVDFVLLQDGENAFRFFKENITVTLDLSIGRATVTMTVPIVTQLREIFATMKIAFSTNQ